MTDADVVLAFLRLWGGPHSERVVHLAVADPATGKVPTTGDITRVYRALCGARLPAAGTERLTELRGMPCVRCSVASPGPGLDPAPQIEGGL